MSFISAVQVVYKEEPQEDKQKKEDREEKKQKEWNVLEEGEDIRLPRDPRQINDVDW